MKLFKPALGILLIVLLSALSANDIFNDIVKAMQGGKAELVGPYFSEKTYLEFPGESPATKSKEESTAMLQRFMTSNPVKSVQIQHRGPSGKKSFVIAIYQSTNGNSFRVTIFVDTEQRRIQELKFENS